MPTSEPILVPFEAGYLKINFLVYRTAYSEHLDAACIPHNHINYEIHYITSGSCLFTINDQLFLAQKGDVLIIPPQKYHGLLKNHIQPDFSQYTYYFYIDPPSTPAEKLASQTFYDFVNNTPCIHTNSQNLLSYCLRLNEESNNKQFGYLNIYQALCSLILTETLRASKIDMPKIYQNQKVRFSDINQTCIDEFFNKNYFSNIKIQDLANYLNFSIRYTNTILNKLYGMSFTQKLITTRLSVAKNQLIYTNDSITKICYDCGFQSHSFFNACFRKNFGITPSEFRKSRKSE